MVASLKNFKSPYHPSDGKVQFILISEDLQNHIITLRVLDTGNSIYGSAIEFMMYDAIISRMKPLEAARIGFIAGLEIAEKNYNEKFNAALQH